MCNMKTDAINSSDITRTGTGPLKRKTVLIKIIHNSYVNNNKKLICIYVFYIQLELVSIKFNKREICSFIIAILFNIELLFGFLNGICKK